MKEKLKNWWMYLLRGILLILLALFVLFNPIEAIVGMTVYIGIGLLMSGAFITTLALLSKKTVVNWGWRLTEGIIDILFGFILLSSPVISASVIPFVVGFWIIVYGTLLFVNSFSEKKEGVASWWVGMVGGLLSIGMGYIIINNTLFGAIAITSWLGIGFLLAGILSINVALRMKQVYKQSFQ
ncbi:HdeD family acid-resistance protein [Carboxylicivirga linearis]|uniref:DUF308 domain-containing protein n=1 Tax=Carboxylicivirga linearis TaxID=1628157 RepID=A0ABS5K1S6_9BACT|nr:DUF308 domain-containing protein [Carboxylicivirga linearis]MBS2101118.1 DUF308 domain-containing protein [Carboxylicivirga linearis]